jgi:hypothetical protein
MLKRCLAIQAPTSQQMSLELDLRIRFGLQIDDVFDAKEPAEKILIFIIRFEQMKTYCDFTPV